MNKISVLILNQSIQELGIIANASFVLGLSAGRNMPDELFGPEVVDGSKSRHAPLTNIGHYVRKAGGQKLSSLRSQLAALEGVEIVDYPEDAGPANYDTYSQALSAHTVDEITYRAIHVIGPEDVIIPLTKNLSRA